MKEFLKSTSGSTTNFLFKLAVYHWYTGIFEKKNQIQTSLKLRNLSMVAVLKVRN